MISPWLIYFVIMLDTLKGLIIAGPVIVSFIPFFIFVNALGEGDDIERKSKIRVKIWSIPCGLLFLIGIFLPTSQQMAAILIIPKMVNSEMAQKLPTDLLKLTEKLLKD